jgi:hypothetical protein
MKEFEPSNHFVSNVMKTVLAYEAELAERRERPALLERLHGSGPIRRLLYYCAPLFGVLFVPATCL